MLEKPRFYEHIYVAYQIRHLVVAEGREPRSIILEFAHRHFFRRPSIGKVDHDVVGRLTRLGIPEKVDRCRTFKHIHSEQLLVHHGIEEHGFPSIHFAHDDDHELLIPNLGGSFSKTRGKVARTFVAQMRDDIIHNPGGSLQQPDHATTQSRKPIADTHVLLHHFVPPLSSLG